MTPPILPDAFASPWAYLTAKQAEFTAQRASAKDGLKALGWILRPNHEVTGGWRARRTTRDGTTHIASPSAAGLVALAQAEFDARQRKAAGR